MSEQDPMNDDRDVVEWLARFQPPAPNPELREKVLAARPPRGRPWLELGVALALLASVAANVLARWDAHARLAPPHVTSALEREAELLARAESLDPSAGLGRRLVATLSRRPRAQHTRTD